MINESFASRIVGLVCFILLVASTAKVTSKTAAGHDKVVVCYLSSWAVYRPSNGSFAIENLDPLLCTHIVYAFAGLEWESGSEDTIKSLDAWQDLRDNYGKFGYERVVGLKNRYPHLKISLAIGGWNEKSANYSRMAANVDRRKRFVKSATEFVRKYNFDGLDLDWEYPTQREGHPADRENFVSLVRELRAEFKPHNLLLTSAIGASRTIIDQAYDVRTLSHLLDYLHVMCYDYGGAWDRRVTANAPLHSADDLNVQSTIEYLVSRGASPAKLVLGVPFYGRSFITLPGGDGRLGDPATDPAMGFGGPYTKENGFLGYNELCTLLDDPDAGWHRTYDVATHQGVARWLNRTSGAWHVVTYDSLRSVAAKARFAVQHRLAGAMVWSVDTDDFHGNCEVEKDIYADFGRAARAQRNFVNFPLLRTLNEAIVLAGDEMRQAEAEAENEIPHGIDDEEDRVTQRPNGVDSILLNTRLLGAMLVVMTVRGWRL